MGTFKGAGGLMLVLVGAMGSVAGVAAGEWAAAGLAFFFVLLGVSLCDDADLEEPDGPVR